MSANKFTKVPQSDTFTDFVPLQINYEGSICVPGLIVYTKVKVQEQKDAKPELLDWLPVIEEPLIGKSDLLCSAWQTPRKLFVFYRTEDRFWPDFADIKHGHIQEFYWS